MHHPPPAVVWAVLACLACSGSPERTGPSEGGAYNTLITRGNRAEANAAEVTTYRAVGATCDDASWVEITGACTLKYSPDNAGFAALPTSGTPVDGWTCHYEGRDWRLFDGVIHTTVDGDDLALRIVAGVACSVRSVPELAPAFLCRDDELLQVDLTLKPDEEPGRIDCPITSVGPRDDDTCGPGFPTLPCEG